jgi:hypothetical protein
MRQGRADEKAGKDSIYRTFLRDLTREESKGVAARLELIMLAAVTDWRAAHAINLSRHPEHFDANRHEIKALRKEVGELHQILRVLAPLPASTPPVDPARPDHPPGEGGS